MEKSCIVCVTGGTGYIGSWLVKKLLEKGYTVHATLRDLKNESKVGLLKSLPHAEARLVLFEADLYNPNEFVSAIQGCEFVFHVATPLQHQSGSEYKNMVEAAVAGSKSIAESCIRAGTVRRLIYTGSVVAASPLKDDGSDFKDSVDETCWTPLNASISHLLHGYIYSKTLIEKDMLSYGNRLEVVSLSLGLVGGDTLQSFLSGSMVAMVSQLTGNRNGYQSLKCLEELLGKIPLVHVDDAGEAHVFCMENPSINGRFLVASSYISSQDIAAYYLTHHPELQVKLEYVQGPKREIDYGSTKLTDKGFVYKYDTKKILDGCIGCARRTGDL
ncbi:hypothetical protein L6164_021209 [Bauhinia variegata]|uniref:Uncharacterized protein n=1 Tax=Bauhinia variegata TaxID=167791 RepID=A0ACB9MXT9_BAUVA|nr:hypothetical protein L6164_021209 [Bauhinia variegata]